MVVTTRGSGSGCSSSTDVGPIDESIPKFITSEIACDILDATPVMFGMIKEEIMELMDERLRTFREENEAGQLAAWTLTFRGFKACRASECFRKKGRIINRRLITDMESTQRTSFCPNGSRVRFVACLMRDRAHDWWEEFGHVLGEEAVETMTFLILLLGSGLSLDLLLRCKS